MLTRSDDHGQITDISIGVSVPTAVVTVSEHLDYSDTAADLPSKAFGELRKQKLTAGSISAEITYDAPTAERDDLGRIRFKTETFAGVTKEIEYSYDERGRLEEATTGSLTETFGYDLNGNRTTYSSRPDGVPEKFGAYDDQDRLTTYGSSTGTAVGDLAFTYGANGELKTKTVKKASGADTWTYGYDPLGNLVTVSKPGTTPTTYTYLVDGLGRRVGKKAKVGTAAETVKKRWLYRDGLAPVAELDSTGAIVARYVYGSRPNVPDLVIKGGSVYRLFVDQLGSPRMAVNVANTADVPYRVEYSAFGTATPIGATALDWIPFGFAGGLLDPDTGLVRFGARDYDASIGRWLSKDPILFGGGQANLYAYVGNDPVNWRDPSGLYWIDASGKRNWDEDETQRILADQIAEFADSTRFGVCNTAFWQGGRYGGRLDFKYSPFFRNDYFWVPGVGRMNAATFGNYFAGYVYQTALKGGAFPNAGRDLALWGGRLTHPGTDGTDDANSIEAINRGALDADRYFESHPWPGSGG